MLKQQSKKLFQQKSLCRKLKQHDINIKNETKGTLQHRPNFLELHSTRKLNLSPAHLIKNFPHCKANLPKLHNFILKSDSHLPKKVDICLIERPLKMIKKMLYFILKALVTLKIFKFLSRLFGHVGKTA